MTAPTFRAEPTCTVVTGAAGWLGRALTTTLRSEGRRVRALARTDDEARALATWGVPADDVVVGDVTDDDVLDRLLTVDTDPVDRTTVDMVHAAGVIHPASVHEFWRTNAAGTRACLAAASRHGVRRVVHVSSNSPFGTNPHAADRFRVDEPYRPYLGYGESKMHAELSVLDSLADGLDAVIVRPPWFYGPYQPERQTTFFRLIKAGRFPLVAGGDRVRSMVYVDHLVDGVRRAQLVDDPPRRAWWVADAEPFPVATIVHTVGEALRAEGHEVTTPRVRIPLPVSRLAERADRAIQRSGRYHQELHVLGELGHHIACDISTTRADLGYEPATTLFEGMRRSIAWCADEGIEL